MTRKARLDTDRTATPRTRIVGHAVLDGKCRAGASNADLADLALEDTETMVRVPIGRVAPCPHCGSTDPETRQDNGPCARDERTYLCVARVAPDAWAFDHVKPKADQIGEDGKVACGMQWWPVG